MKNITRMILFTLALLLCLASFGGIHAEESLIKMYSDEEAPDGSRFKNTGEGIVAVRLNVKGGKFVGLVVPSWYAAPMSTALILYKWDTDYRTTISGSPIFSDMIEDSVSQGWVNPGEADFTVDFDRAFAEGEYLLVYYRLSGNPLHIPTHAAHSDSVAYFEQEVYENVSYRINCIVDPAAELNEEPNTNIDSQEVIIAAYGNGASADGLSYIQVGNYASVAHKFSVKNGKFTGIVFNDLFLETGYGEIELKVYKWKDDYDTTTSQTPIYHNVIEAESGGPGQYEHFYVRFDRAYALGDYLVEISCYDGLNLWAHATKEGVTSYLDGDVYEEGTLKLDIIENLFAELDERPVYTPEPTETPEPTPTLETTPTQTAAETEKPTETGEKDDKGNTGIIIGVVVVAIIAVAAIVFIIIRSKKGRE